MAAARRRRSEAPQPPPSVPSSPPRRAAPSGRRNRSGASGIAAAVHRFPAGTGARRRPIRRRPATPDFADHPRFPG
jgi:hypothetical protein